MACCIKFEYERANERLSLAELIELPAFVVAVGASRAYAMTSILSSNDLPALLICCSDRRRNSSRRRLDFSVKLYRRVKFGSLLRSNLTRSTNID